MLMLIQRKPNPGCRSWLRMVGCLLLLGGTLVGCSTPPPRAPDELCQIFAQHPSWYRAAWAAQKKWGTSVAVTMAFVHRESSYRANAKPPRTKLLWIVPWRRPSTAYGYAQATNETWEDYLRLRGGWFRNRNDFADAVDFIGWYNHLSRRELGLASNDAYSLYLAYYHGRGGYRRGAHKRNADSPGFAAKVAARAAQYSGQQAKCPKPPARFWR
jgi:hypothetical protein